MLIFNFLFRKIVSKVNLDRFMSLKTPYTIKRLSWYCITFNHQMRSLSTVKWCPDATQRVQRKLWQKTGAFADVSINEKQKKIKVLVVEAPNPVFFSNHITATRWEYSEGSEWTSKNALNMWTMFTGDNQVSHFPVLQMSLITSFCPSMPWWRSCTPEFPRYAVSEWLN